jgi:hypothetical protein
MNREFSRLAGASPGHILAGGPPTPVTFVQA